MRRVLRYWPVGLLLAACNTQKPATLNDNTASCAVPTSEGCPCVDPGVTIECGSVVRRADEYVTCSMGKQTCLGGKWGACSHDFMTNQSVSPIGSGISTQGLGGSSPCKDNPCNPNCMGFTADDTSNLDPGDGGAAVTEGGITIAMGAEAGADAGACKNLQCQVVNCGGNVHTTLTGTVYDPAGANPVYGATVFVPNAALPVFTPGVAADQCSSNNNATAVASTTTGADGKFTLLDVPVGANIPLVVQVGRWRRQVTIANVPKCATTAVTAAQTRLPAKQAEGDMPQMAITTGDADPFECLMLKMGIDKTEFTNDSGSGRVHVYQDNGTTLTSGSTKSATNLYKDLNVWKKYNAVILPCEGQEDDKGKNYEQNLIDYTNAGGRVFTTHYGYAWLQLGLAPFTTVVNWNNPNNQFNTTDPMTGYVDTSFPKGVAYQSWLSNVGASPKLGQVTLNEPRWNVMSTAGATQRWMYGWSTNIVKNNPDTVQTFTFNTPVGAQPQNQIGRVVFTNFHVSASAVCNSNKGFPDRCCAGSLSAQEKALEFMLFDVTSCVSPDIPPPPPTPPYTKPATFIRDYDAVCPTGKKVVWRYFDYMTTTPSDTSIVFSAQTAATQGTLGAATPVQLSKITGAPIVSWTGVDVSTKLPTPSKEWLRVTMTLNPSTDGYSAPTVNSWRQLFDCVDSL